VFVGRCLDDVDDEVRDRAAMYLRVLDDEPLAETFVKDGEGARSLKQDRDKDLISLTLDENLGCV
jgi:hypothetical protein